MACQKKVLGSQLSQVGAGFWPKTALGGVSARLCILGKHKEQVVMRPHKKVYSFLQLHTLVTLTLTVSHAENQCILTLSGWPQSFRRGLFY